MPIKNSAYEMLNKIALFSKVFCFLSFPVWYYVGKPKARRLTTEGNHQQNDSKLVLVFSSPFLRRKRSGSVILHVIVFSWSGVRKL